MGMRKPRPRVLRTRRHPIRRGWLRKRREQVEHKFVELRDTVEAKRETSTPIAVAYDTFGRDTSTGGSVLAAALGFRIFLFYVPYIFFFAFAFGLGADAANESASDLARRGGMGAVTAQAVGSAADLSLWTRIVTVVVTGYALYAGARGVVKVLRVSYGLVWNVPVPRLRKSWRAALFFIALTTLALATLRARERVDQPLPRRGGPRVDHVHLRAVRGVVVHLVAPPPPAPRRRLGAGTGRDRVRGGRRDPAPRHRDLDPVSRLDARASATGRSASRSCCSSGRICWAAS